MRGEFPSLGLIPIAPLSESRYEVQGFLIVTRQQIRPNSVENPSSLPNHLSRISLFSLQLGNLGGDV